jgi:cysteinyl-tRNA synthetase
MAEHHLGLPVDVHGGGIDLIFPHHYDENEVALTLRGTRFARRYVHTAFVTEDGEKMSKSTGRLVALRPELDRYGPDALRLYLLSPPFGQRLEWSDAGLKSSADRWARIASTLRASVPVGGGGSAPFSALRTARRQIETALHDGLGVGRAFTILERLAGSIRAAGRAEFPRGSRREVRDFLAAVDARLGLGLSERGR